VALALGIGLLIGTERERRREARGTGFAGLRTFALASLLGGLFGYLDDRLLIVAGAAVVGVFAVAAYVVNRDDPDRGITTEVALVVTYVLGVLALESPLLAASVAVITTWILALRGELHALVAKTLTERELRDLLIFLLFALVVMPLAPNQSFGPYGAVNPQLLVRLVVVLMAITGCGYIAQRLLDPRVGLMVTGLVAGFISSSATIGAMSIRAREQPETWRSAATAALASSVATVVQYVIVIGAVDPGMLPVVAPSLAIAALVAAGVAGVFAWRSFGTRPALSQQSRAFRLWPAVGFAGIFVLVTIAASALQERIGTAGIVLASSVAAFVDAHSTAGSVAAMHRVGGIDATSARLAVLGALSTNTVTKVVLAWTGRRVDYGLSVSLGVVLIAGSAWLGLLFG